MLLLAENGKYTIKELALMLNKNSDTIKEHIANLKKEGKLIRVGSTKSGYWRALDAL